MTWFWLALLSAFSLATADAVTKRYLSSLSSITLMKWRFICAALWLSPLLVLQPWPDLPLAFWAWVAALVPLEILAMVLCMRAIRSSPLAYTVPYLAFTPVMTTITANLLLGERVSPAGLAGIALVVAGAWMLNVGRVTSGHTPRWLMPVTVIAKDSGARLMLAVAALYSLTSVLGKGALQYAPPMFFGSFYFCLLGVIVLVIFRRGDTGTDTAPPARLLPALALGLAMAVMVVSHFMAIELADVSYMIAVKRSSLLFGILYGALLFRERNLTRHLFAGALMVAGVAVLSSQAG